MTERQTPNPNLKIKVFDRGMFVGHTYLKDFHPRVQEVLLMGIRVCSTTPTVFISCKTNDPISWGDKLEYVLL